MKIVRLRNGADQDMATVGIDHEILVAIYVETPEVFRELIDHCRTGTQLSPATHEILNGWCIINEQGLLYEEMKNVALSMVEGEGDAMTLVNPVDHAVVAPDPNSFESLLRNVYNTHLREAMPDGVPRMNDIAAGPPLIPKLRFYH